MRNSLLVDTNILIYLLDGNIDVRNILMQKDIFISFVTEMELLSKRNINKREVAIIEEMLTSCVIYEMNEKIKSGAINFMRNERLKMPDAIIAATSLYYKIELLTADAVFKSFSNAHIIKL